MDNRSRPPLALPAWVSSWLPLRILICSRPGPAAARNVGARQASGKWILFLDSDCQPTEKLIEGYQHTLNGSVVYAGAVQAKGTDLFSCYYDAQAILVPPPLQSQGEERPNFLITANALIWRQAFIQIGGFDEQFYEAGGEDIDLGLRLWSVGPLSYAPQALVFHTFEPDLMAFLRRFVRYGRANRRLGSYYHTDLTPQPFMAVVGTPSHRLLAKLQFLALRWGYATAARPTPRASSGCNGGALSWSKGAAEEQEREGPRDKQVERNADIALFIDGDNISADVFESIWLRVTEWGPVRFCQVYCQRPSPKWERVRQEYPLITICRQVGKETDCIFSIFRGKPADELSPERSCPRFTNCSAPDF